MQDANLTQLISRMFRKLSCMQMKSKIIILVTGEQKKCHLLNKKQNLKITYLGLANTTLSKYLKNYLFHRETQPTLTEGAD